MLPLSRHKRKKKPTRAPRNKIPSLDNSELPGTHLGSFLCVCLFFMSVRIEVILNGKILLQIHIYKYCINTHSKNGVFQTRYAQHHAALRSITQHYAALRSITQHYAALRSTQLRSTTQHCASPRSTTQHHAT
jgi:hypothetical protein